MDNRKTILFIDNSNIFQSQSKYFPKDRIHWGKVLEYFENINTPIFETHFFGSHPDPPNAMQDGFFKYLANTNKFHLHLRQLVKRTHSCSKCKKKYYKCPHCEEPLTDKQEKGVDVDIAVELIKQSDNLDTAILFSGDKDLIGPIDYIKGKGKRVEIYAFKESITDEYNKKYIPVNLIDDIMPLISKPRFESKKEDTTTSEQNNELMKESRINKIKKIFRLKK